MEFLRRRGGGEGGGGWGGGGEGYHGRFYVKTTPLVIIPLVIDDQFFKLFKVPKMTGIFFLNPSHFQGMGRYGKDLEEMG